MSHTPFDEKRTAQAAAFLLFKAGGRLPVLKLMKLLYLAERESYRVFGEPITGDGLVSMPYGPVLSTTLDLMNGASRNVQDGWAAWMQGREGHNVALRDPSMIRTPEQDLRALSDGDLEVLQSTWDKYGYIAKFDLVQLTHTGECPEWEDPEGSSLPIKMEKLFACLGYTPTGVRSAMQHLQEQRELRASLG